MSTVHDLAEDSPTSDKDKTKSNTEQDENTVAQSPRKIKADHGKVGLSPKSAPAEADNEDEDEDEAMIVDPPHPPPAGTSSSTSGSSSTAIIDAHAEDDDDGGCQLVAVKGDMALIDYPHSREWCVKHKFTAGNERKCCANCYCFVCDAPASTCPRWDQHCMATHSSPHWASQRQQWRLYKGAPPPPPPAAAAASSSTSGVPDDNHIAKKVSRWSCDELLAAIQQVYPVEAPEPPGFEPSKTLRPYQKQSLAFMVASEQSTDKATAGHNEVTNLPVRGGWLCDEMGMGKTAVCASLVLANPSKAKPVSDAEFKNLLNDGAPCHKYKATLIIVNNTLVQQWKEDILKFAPNAEIYTYYSTRENHDKAQKNLRTADIILTTPHMLFPPAFVANVHFHRVVLDEAHLLAVSGGGGFNTKLRALNKFKTDNTWLVTGTPFSNNLNYQLSQQARLLGMTRINEIWGGQLRPNWTAGQPGDAGWRKVDVPPYHPLYRMVDVPPDHPCDDLTNEDVVDRLKNVMIRHVKNMRIGGDVALALPDADCSTEWLTMSEDERMLYQLHECADGGPFKLDEMDKRFKACTHLYDAAVVAGNVGTQRDEHLNRFRRVTPSAEDDKVAAGASKPISTSDAQGSSSAAAGDGAPGSGSKAESAIDVDAGTVTEEDEEVVEAAAPPVAVEALGRGMRQRKSVVKADAEMSEKARGKRAIVAVDKEQVVDVDDDNDADGITSFSLSKPLASGKFLEASRAFLATHSKLLVSTKTTALEKRQRVREGKAAQEFYSETKWQPDSTLTKFAALMKDLKELRDKEPNCKCVVFTRFNEVQQRLVELVKEQTTAGGVLASKDHKPLIVYEFNGKTAPAKRHKSIADFQDATSTGSRVMIVTYATAAVGITLTAASRVFLMEPTLDPAQEAQAAGRIHRLGQDKEIFIKRYAFKSSIEEAVIKLHEKIKDGTIKIRDGVFPQEAIKLMSQAGAAMPHDFTGPVFDRTMGVDCVKYRPYHSNISAKFSTDNSWTRECKEQACACCGLRRIVKGSSKWSGTGIYAYLNDIGVAEPPFQPNGWDVDGQKHAHMSYWERVPPPPAGWMPSHFAPFELCNVDEEYGDQRRIAQAAASHAFYAKGGGVAWGGMPYKEPMLCNIIRPIQDDFANDDRVC